MQPSHPYRELGSAESAGQGGARLGGLRPLPRIEVTVAGLVDHTKPLVKLAVLKSLKDKISEKTRKNCLGIQTASGIAEPQAWDPREVDRGSWELGEAVGGHWASHMREVSVPTNPV